MDAVPIHIASSDVQLGPDHKVVTEHEPEHFVFYTRVIPPYTGSVEPGVEGTGAWYEQIAGLDPFRKSISVYTPDGAMILCHSEAQASAVSNIASGTPFPDGAYFPQGAAPSMDGTGPVWVVNPGSSSIRITIVTNRWGQ